MTTALRRTTWLALLLAATTVNPAQAQAPRRTLPTGFTRDTVGRLATTDSINRPTFRPELSPVVQDSTRQCRSTTGYVLFGGFIGFLFGSARYEKGLSDGVDYMPWLSIPWTVGPYVLGGMLLGHLIAPC